MDYFIAIIFVELAGYIIKSLFDAIGSPVLSQREKTNAAYVIVTFPMIGSILFYFYHSHRLRKHLHSTKRMQAH